MGRGKQQSVLLWVGAWGDCFWLDWVRMMDEVPPSMKAGRGGFAVSPPQTASSSPNPRLTGRSHIWLQSVEEQRQRLGGVINWGMVSPPRCCPGTLAGPQWISLFPQSLLSTSLHRVPQVSNRSRSPSCHLAGAPSPPSSPYHASPHTVPPPQVCKPSVNSIPGRQPLSSCPPTYSPHCRQVPIPCV